MQNTILSIVFMGLICCACDFSNKSFVSNYMRNYSDIDGQKVVFSQSLRPANESDLLQKQKNPKFKIVFTGYVGCSPCVLKLKSIEKYVKKNRALLKNVEVMYVAAGEFSEYFDIQLKKNQCSFTVKYDYEQRFIEDNQLEKFGKGAILLNGNDEIVFIGSPLDNNIIDKYYKELIKNEAK